MTIKLTFGDDKFTKWSHPWSADGTIKARYKSWEATAKLVHDCDSTIDNYDCYSIEQAIADKLPKKEIAKLTELRESYLRQEWCFVGVVVKVYKCGIELGEFSLWGLECGQPGSDNDYLNEVANDCLIEAIDEAERNLERLSKFE